MKMQSRKDAKPQRIKLDTLRLRIFAALRFFAFSHAG
jgi:hypothetical protein